MSEGKLDRDNILTLPMEELRRRMAEIEEELRDERDKREQQNLLVSSTSVIVSAISQRNRARAMLAKYENVADTPSEVLAKVREQASELEARTQELAEWTDRMRTFVRENQIIQEAANYPESAREEAIRLIKARDQEKRRVVFDQKDYHSPVKDLHALNMSRLIQAHKDGELSAIPELEKAAERSLSELNAELDPIIRRLTRESNALVAEIDRKLADLL